MRNGKVVVVQQYFGLGDIIFCQRIARYFLFQGYKVIWPVLPHLVEGLNRAYPDVLFVDHTKFLINYENKKYEEIDNMLHLPLRYSESLMGRPYEMHMKSKYDYVGVNWMSWVECDPIIDKIKSRQLFRRLELSPIDKFNFIATDFGNSGKKVNIPLPDNEYRNVYLEKIDGYSLFDWVPIMQCAEEIHAVSSSTLYLFELFCRNPNQTIHLYVRKPVEKDFKYVDFIFTRDYILHL